MTTFKTTETAWNSSHVHRNFRKGPLWRTGWNFKSKSARHGEQPNGDDAVSQYPAAVSTFFDRAIKCCPSISIDPGIMEGQPCIAGTRVPVRAVLRAIEQYGSIEEAQRCYPHLTKEQVRDAVYFSQLVLELP